MALTRAWRASSAEHEAEYGDMVRIVTLSACVPALVTDQRPPTAQDVIARRVAGRSEPEGGGKAHGRGGTAAARRWLVAAAALLILGIPIALLVSLGSDDVEPGFGAEAFVTGPAETATIILSDGSVVKLAPHSRLQLEPNRSERSVALNGQAFFSVAPMNGRPFVVHTAEGEVRVLGTRFDLAARGDDLQLVVVEGRVAISGGGLEGEIHAGQVGRVVAGTPLPVLEIDDPHEITEWTGQFIAFQSTPLADAAREIMRHYPVRIVVTDSAVARRTITAWFSDWRLEDVMTVVCAVAEARCSTDGDVITIEPDRGRGARQ
jgi:ferric-dicitrate binding protein FerR (iron transport regulator)